MFLVRRGYPIPSRAHIVRLGRLLNSVLDLLTVPGTEVVDTEIGAIKAVVVAIGSGLLNAGPGPLDVFFDSSNGAR